MIGKVIVELSKVESTTFFIIFILIDIICRSDIVNIACGEANASDFISSPAQGLVSPVVLRCSPGLRF